MGERLNKTGEIIEYEGAQILFNDFSGLKGQELADALKASTKVMLPKMASGKRDWLSVNVFNDCFFDEAATKIVMKVHKGTVGYFVAVADVGLSSIQSMAVKLADSLSGSKIPIKFADTVEEAKKWVVEVYKERMKQKAQLEKR